MHASEASPPRKDESRSVVPSGPPSSTIAALVATIPEPIMCNRAGNSRLAGMNRLNTISVQCVATAKLEPIAIINTSPWPNAAVVTLDIE